MIDRRPQIQARDFLPSRFKNRNAARSWQSVPFSWEKKFCLINCGITWKKLIETKRRFWYFDKVVHWDDSAGEEAFHNAKARFWAKINGFSCDLPLPDPDSCIDDIDWDCHIDPYLVEDLSHGSPLSDDNWQPSWFKHLSSDKQIVPPGWGDDLHLIVPTGWGDEEEAVPSSQPIMEKAEGTELTGWMESAEKKVTAVHSSWWQEISDEKLSAVNPPRCMEALHENSWTIQMTGWGNLASERTVTNEPPGWKEASCNKVCNTEQSEWREVTEECEITQPTGEAAICEIDDAEKKPMGTSELVRSAGWIATESLDPVGWNYPHFQAGRQNSCLGHEGKDDLEYLLGNGEEGSWDNTRCQGQREYRQIMNESRKTNTSSNSDWSPGKHVNRKLSLSRMPRPSNVQTINSSEVSRVGKKVTFAPELPISRKDPSSSWQWGNVRTCMPRSRYRPQNAVMSYEWRAKPIS